MLWARAGAGYIHLGLGGSVSLLYCTVLYCCINVLYLTLHSDQTKPNSLDCSMNQPIYSFVSKQKPYQLGHWLFVYINSVFTPSKIVTHNFLDPSESLIYFQFKLLKSLKVFLKQNVNTFYLKD